MDKDLLISVALLSGKSIELKISQSCTINDLYREVGEVLSLHPRCIQLIWNQELLSGTIKMADCGVSLSDQIQVVIISNVWPKLPDASILKISLETRPDRADDCYIERVDVDCDINSGWLALSVLDWDDSVAVLAFNTVEGHMTGYKYELDGCFRQKENVETKIRPSNLRAVLAHYIDNMTPVVDVSDRFWKLLANESSQHNSDGSVASDVVEDYNEVVVADDDIEAAEADWTMQRPGRPDLQTGRWLEPEEGCVEFKVYESILGWPHRCALLDIARVLVDGNGHIVRVALHLGYLEDFHVKYENNFKSHKPVYVPAKASVS